MIESGNAPRSTREAIEGMKRSSDDYLHVDMIVVSNLTVIHNLKPIFQKDNMNTTVAQNCSR